MSSPGDYFGMASPATPETAAQPEPPAPRPALAPVIDLQSRRKRPATQRRTHSQG